MSEASDKLSTNEQYDEYAPKWKRIRDVMGGLDNMLAAGTEHVPALSGQSSDDYDAYLKRAHFLDATAKTEEAFRGLLFKTPVEVENAAEIEDLTADMDLQDTDINALAEEIASEVMQTNRLLAVVNYSDGIAARPYVELWKAETIFDWSTAFVNGAHNLAYVKLYEGLTVDPGTGELAETVRELRLDPIGETGVYGYVTQQFWRRETQEKKGNRYVKKLEWIAGEVITPLKDNTPWPYIPCFLFGPRRGYDCRKPSLLGIADLNISHYRTAADLEHGAHYTALPTAYITGAAPNTTSLSIGSGEAWVIENENAKVDFLEFTGAGLGALERLLDRKQAMMAAEGARMLSPEKGQAESGHALQLRQGAEHASLNTLSDNLSLGLTVLLLYMLDWAGRDIDAAVSVNADFSSPMLSAQEITALLAAWQGGAISLDTFLYNMKRGGRINDQQSIDDEKEAIRDGDGMGGPAVVEDPPSVVDGF